MVFAGTITKEKFNQLQDMNLENILSTPNFDRTGLLKFIFKQFKISRDGVHGPSHWSRVRFHGLKVGAMRGADLLVIELFAFLHDSQRINEYSDPLHGARAADFAASLNGQFFDLTAEQLDKLCYAIRHHSGGNVDTCETIQSCWDGDRLDLGRVGIKPHIDYLSEEGASFISLAYKMSRD